MSGFHYQKMWPLNLPQLNQLGTDIVQNQRYCWTQGNAL